MTYILDNLQEFLAGSSTKFGIMTITEISEKEDIGFLNNVEMEVYEIYHTASKSSKGGTAIYVNKNFDTIARSELNVNNVEYESTWIEIKKKIVKILYVVLYIDTHIILIISSSISNHV